MDRVGTSLAIISGLAAAGCGTIRAGYDSAPYRVIRTAGKIELREYPALVLVETRPCSA